DMLLEYPQGKEGGFTLPDTVATIGTSAFWGCAGLTSVWIGTGLTNDWSYQFYPFSDCTALTNITVSPLNPAFRSFDGVLFDKSQHILWQYPPGRPGGYIVPGTVTNISGAFVNCAGLTRVTIPKSVTDIPLGSFSGCT